MVEITREFVVGVLKGDNPPAAYCEDGETVIFHTRDCYDDSVISEDQKPLDQKFANPATGPLFVRGAEPGDVLKIEILKIELAPTAVMRTSLTAGGLTGIIQEKETKIFVINQDKIRFDQHLVLKTDPMIGVIGTTPFNDDSIPTDTPREHGGNMDCRLIQAGSTLYLPVNHAGGLLALGDLHALMADGEVMICGMETRGKVTVQVHVLKEIELPTPFLFHGDQVMTIQSALTLDEAARLCSEKLHEFVMRSCKLSINRTAMLMSLLAHMTICQVVDPLKTVRMSFPLRVLEQYGYRLP